MLPGQLIASGQLTNPGVNFASVHGLTSVRDCSLFIGSTGPVFRGTGQGLFLMLPSTGHKDFCVFMVRDMNFFGEKNLSNYIL